MGSLVSVPKISTTPQKVVYTTPKTVSRPTAATPRTTVTTSSSTSSSNNSSTPATDSAAIAAEREGNLLRRSRGLSGTIQTSFRGLLGLNDTQQRKTLLGE